MKKGEKALLRCRQDYAYGSSSPSPVIPAGATLSFEVDLVSFGPRKKDKWEMSSEEKVAEAVASKEAATIAFKSKDFALALDKYLTAAEMVDDVEDEDSKALWITCHLNAAQVRTRAGFGLFWLYCCCGYVLMSCAYCTV
jgi:hypothetical protein